MPTNKTILFSVASSRNYQGMDNTRWSLRVLAVRNPAAQPRILRRRHLDV